MSGMRRGAAGRQRSALPVVVWIAALLLGPLVGAFVGAVAGMLIGDSLGSPEGEGFIGFWYGGVGGAAIGFLLALAVLVFVQTRRGRPTRAAQGRAGSASRRGSHATAPEVEPNGPSSGS